MFLTLRHNLARGRERPVAAGRNSAVMQEIWRLGREVIIHMPELQIRHRGEMMLVPRTHARCASRSLPINTAADHDQDAVLWP